ncbi:MAG: pilus assembly protein, partial [Planctomycetota bacterium]|nr:pilus assembly protein [Planctomycetota bacterium]
MVNLTHQLRPVLRQRKSASRGGATTVETVLVLSVWILLLAGTFDLGMAVLRYNTLAHTARQGARQAIVHGKLAAPQRTVWGPSKYIGKASDAHEISQAVLPYLTGFTASEVTVTV